MNSRSHFFGKPIAIASVFLASIVLVACEQSKQPAPSPTAAASLAATSEKVFVVFEGPWAFVTDPKDPNIILALAPKTKSHHDLQVSASNRATLATGTYDLSVPAHSTVTAGTPDPSFAQAQIDAKSLDRSLNAKSERYVIRLPKPETYLAATRYRSRVGASYPPDASTERDHVTSASLRYGVSSLAGFSLAGTPDSGTFNPLLLQIDTPTITFLIEPVQADDPLDNCETHSREGFRDLTKLLNITLYVDFPESTSGCRDKDPQKPRAAKAEAVPSRLERLAALLEGNLTDAQVVSASSVETAPGHINLLTWGVPRALAQHVTIALYLFGIHTGTCKAPILILMTSP